MVVTPCSAPKRWFGSEIQVSDNGSFGTMYQAQLAGTRELVLINKGLWNKRFKNQQLMIMFKMHIAIV